MPLVIAWMTGTPNRSRADGPRRHWRSSPSANDSVETITSARPLDQPQRGRHAVCRSARRLEVNTASAFSPRVLERIDQLVDERGVAAESGARDRTARRPSGASDRRAGVQSSIVAPSTSRR